MNTTNSKDDAIPLFLSFCIEQYKNAMGITGKESMEILDRTGTLAYLEECYEPIHTQSPQWILQEIEDYINSRK
jgi:hypothetical protein